MGWIAWLIFGALAGWVASMIAGTNERMGCLLNIVVGIAGAFIGGWLSGVLHVSPGSGWIGSTITAFVGAVILLFVIRLFRRA
jgi:uncharacterized membrane protein YeaQ/YmgE (transglycosylase-associated protein family)